MTKWANPTNPRRVHPAWYSILFGIGIVVLLVLTCEGCHVHGHFHMGGGQSKEPPITILLPENDDD